MKHRQAEQQKSKPEELIEITEELKAVQEEALVKEKQCKQMIEDPGESKKHNFRDYNQNQVYFVPVRLDRFLESDHPARVIDIVVERMDLSSLYERYSDDVPCFDYINPPAEYGTLEL